MFILFVEHNPERQRVVGEALEAAGHRIEKAGSAADALIALARPGPPDVILLEDRLPHMHVAEFLEAVARMGVGCHVVVYGEEDRAAGWVEATGLGLLDYVRVDDQGVWLGTLGERLARAQQRSVEEGRAHLLAAALDSTAAAVLLVDRAGRVRYANDACKRLVNRTRRDLEEHDLHELVRFDEDTRVRSHLFSALETDGEWAGEIDVLRPDGERIPTIVTLSPIRRADRAGSAGFVLTLRDVSDRVAMEGALRAANRRLAEQAARDPLTGLYNRRYFREVLDREGARNCRYGEPLTVLMSDLDRFKQVNDVFGHDEGDRVLLEVARALPDGLREGDVVARLGGDEILPAAAQHDGGRRPHRGRASARQRPRAGRLGRAADPGQHEHRTGDVSGGAGRAVPAPRAAAQALRHGAPRREARRRRPGRRLHRVGLRVPLRRQGRASRPV